MKKYEINELVMLAKRDNNKKRPYLYVNPLQGKHIPVSPGKALELFDSLSELLTQEFPGERLLLIGFAETATAIGAAVAVSCPAAKWYAHTTRERVRGAKEYLYFSEVHSHATEQKLAADTLEPAMSLTDRIVFVEDEVTTGNTIRSLMESLKARFPRALELEFAVLSILNSMTEECLEDFQENRIPCLCLKHLENQDFSGLENFSYASRKTIGPGGSSPGTEASGSVLVFPGGENPRMGVEPGKYREACVNFAGRVLEALMEEAADSGLFGKRVLVLGTEEFMYPCLTAAALIEKDCGCECVRFHATTRSPILPSPEEAYPLHSRYELRSAYDGERVTYVYNLEAYDYVVWLNDAEEESEAGIRTMTESLIRAGCGAMIMGRWGD